MILINKGFSTRLILRAALVAVIACTSGLARAGTPATPCDPEYMDALEARAYLEAQREVAQNQNYIVKPDSVLEYTCFDSMLGAFASDEQWGGGPNPGQCDNNPFSDSCRWGNVFDQTYGDLWDSVDNVVIRALKPYLQGQFHWNKVTGPGTPVNPITRNYLDGRGTAGYPVPLPVEQETTPFAYKCSEMDSVWMQAHCYNFMQEGTHDEFYDFFWYAKDKSNNDPRAMNGDDVWESPVNACPTPIEDTTSIEVAYNNNGPKYALETENPWSLAFDTNPYDADLVVSHLDLILPVASPNPPAPATCTDVNPVPTGVCVVRTGWNTAYQDAVCPNPGCYYKAPGAAGNGADPTGCPGSLGTCAGP